MKRAIIESIIDDYHVCIRIPQLHGTKGSENYVATDRLPVATICVQPGTEAAYNVGDIVFVKRYDEETGKFMYFEKELTEEEFDELKFRKIHEERALEGTRKQVKLANDILDKLEIYYKDAKKVYPLIQRKKVKNEEQEAIKKIVLDTTELIIEGAEKILELKSAKEIINLYVDNKMDNTFKYLICCAKMANKDVDEEHVSKTFIVIYNIDRYLSDVKIIWKNLMK